MDRWIELFNHERLMSRWMSVVQGASSTETTMVQWKALAEMIRKGVRHWEVSPSLGGSQAL